MLGNGGGVEWGHMDGAERQIVKFIVSISADSSVPFLLGVYNL
jgi:hypothetical protein